MNVDAQVGERIEERVRAGSGDPVPGAPDEEKARVEQPLHEPAGTP